MAGGRHTRHVLRRRHVSKTYAWSGSSFSSWPTPSSGASRLPPDPLTRSCEAGKERNEYARPRPRESAAKILLDSEALARTLSRIAHEIIERNDDLGRLALVGIHTRGVPLAERLATLIEERSGEEIALGAVDITFHRDDTIPGAEQPVVHATALDFDLRGTTCVLVDDVLYTGRTIRAAIETLFEHGRPGARSARRPRRPRPPRAADPARLRGQEPPNRAQRADPGRARGDRRSRPDPARGRAGGAEMRHLISIADLDPRRRRADPRDRRRLRRRRGEAADAAGQARAQPLLRVVDAHLVELRARREEALRGRDVAEGRRLVAGQGRVAQGHGAHAGAVRPARDRHSPPADRRAGARRTLLGCGGRQRRRRQAPAPDPGAPRPLRDARRARKARRPPRGDRRRRPPQPCRTLAHPGSRRSSART